MVVPAYRARAALLLVVALLASLVVVTTSPGAARATTTGKVRGNIDGPQGGDPKVQLLWFTKDWDYRGKRNMYGGGYSISLPPGTYHLQFVDQRPAYDVTKYAPTDVRVTVRANHTTVKNVHMQKGAAVTGTVRDGRGAPGKNARVVAANAGEQSFSVKANGRGQFALGGLPQGSYSLFTYDARREWVGKSAWVPGVKPGRPRNIDVRMDRHAGSLTVDLYTPNGPIVGRPYVTAVSKQTGQFWTSRAAHGSVVFRGLHPGGYRLEVPGVGDWLESAGSVNGAKVRPGRMAFGSFRLTQRGAWVTGTVVDQEDPSYPLEGAQVLLYGSAGDVVGSTTSNSDGRFRFGGALRTQDGLMVVAQPGPYSEYLGQGTHYCKYERTETELFAVTTGEQTEVGDVELPHRPAAEQDGPQCYPARVAGRQPSPTAGSHRLATP